MLHVFAPRYLPARGGVLEGRRSTGAAVAAAAGRRRWLLHARCATCVPKCFERHGARRVWRAAASFAVAYSQQVRVCGAEQ